MITFKLIPRPVPGFKWILLTGVVLFLAGMSPEAFAGGKKLHLSPIAPWDRPHNELVLPHIPAPAPVTLPTVTLGPVTTAEGSSAVGVQLQLQDIGSHHYGGFSSKAGSHPVYWDENGPI